MLTAVALAFQHVSMYSARARTQRTASLSPDWLFGPLDAGDSPDVIPDTDLSTVQLPHTAVDLSWRAWNPSAWERPWLYRNHFEASEDPRHRSFLRFEGALTTTTPILNGRTLDAHAGGYLPFQHEVTGLLARHNTLDVVVNGEPNPATPPNHGSDRPSSAVDFWQPAGLCREVELISVPGNHIADVFAKPVDVLDDSRRGLEVHCELDLAEAAADLALVAELRRDNATLTSATTRLPALPPGRSPVTLRLGGLHDIALWSVDSPELYDVVVTLSEQERPIHDRHVRTGFREARFDRSGFFLNGRRLHLFGLNRHQFLPFSGGAAPARIQRRDAEILRNELNCTMVRCSHYPQHESFLSACDELGLLVWAEPPGWQYLGGDEWLDRAYRDVHDMIVRDRNHPSVVLWAARLNETSGNTSFYSRTEKMAKSLDDSRQTTGAILAADHDTTDFQHDVFSYNDYSTGTAPDGTPHPELAPPRADFPYLVSEAVGTLAGPTKFYRRTDPQDIQQAQALAHARVHDLGRSDEHYAGVLAWAGYDYPSGHGNIHQGIKWPGVVDLFRVLKPGAAVYRAQVDPQRRPVIQPSFYWDFGTKSPVTELGARAAIWSNVDRLELFLDGRAHATLYPARSEYPNLLAPPFFADFSEVSGAPELRIDGFLGDRPLLSRRFSANPARDRLALTVDDPVLTAGGSDGTRAELRAVDAYANDRPYVAGSVELRLSGPAVLVGANPFPLDETGGAGAVWLRSSREGTGTVVLRARHPTLGTAEVRFSVEPGPTRTSSGAS